MELVTTHVARDILVMVAPVQMSMNALLQPIIVPAMDNVTIPMGALLAAAIPDIMAME